MAPAKENNLFGNFLYHMPCFHLNMSNEPCICWVPAV